jgi:hypothetical protein
MQWHLQRIVSISRDVRCGRMNKKRPKSTEMEKRRRQGRRIRKKNKKN